MMSTVNEHERYTLMHQQRVSIGPVSIVVSFQ